MNAEQSAGSHIHPIVRVPLSTGAPLIEATFAARPSQFLIEAQMGGRMVRAHLADRGRLTDMLVPGARLLLAPREEIGRKTAFQVVAVYQGHDLVSLDTQLPNRLVAAALSLGALPQFARYSRVQREVQLGPHRIDFRLSEGLDTCWLEVKSVTRIIDNVAVFPDAPTERGSNHLELLTNAARNGQRAAVMFIIQRSQGCAFAPDESIDRAFSRALRTARSMGVEMYAYVCPVSITGVTLGREVPIFASLDAVPPELRRC
ncbi:DNA/RNA nuclease SfsA [Chloroflexus sp.]|uniref:DNA/RNA nuclease SfsA n=1 Tax=Chloroflexus sp. TaxID=1904827 RepID=UPI00298F0F45|nr:DNA/RNA nuclease SfsA [Chloroflexus sp.]MDW8405303.1 DNA/RNA nuclease SfsA [Chloroflexus sp.]